MRYAELPLAAHTSYAEVFEQTRKLDDFRRVMQAQELAKRINLWRLMLSVDLKKNVEGQNELQYQPHIFGYPNENQDFRTIRTAFRQAGGDWQRIFEGDPVQHLLLSTLITAWAQMPGREMEQEKV